MTYKNRFDGGELDKWCLGAVDDPMFQRGCAWLENFNLLENGGLNRRKGYKRFCKILEGLDDEAIKMVPLPVDSKTGYVLFVTRNRFGAVKFTDGEFDSLIEKPWPGAFVIDDAHTFVRRKTDPDAFWYLPHPEAPIYIQSDDELPVGATAAVVLPYEKEAAVVKIGERTEVEVGKADVILPHKIEALPFLAQGNLTQTPKKEEDETMFSYFEEEGVGSGLLIQCKVGAPDPKTKKIKVEFTVLDGGTGYKGDKNGRTFLNMRIPDIGVVEGIPASVGAGGNIAAIDTYEFQGNLDYTGGPAWWRWKAPPIANNVYSEFQDMAGRIPSIDPQVAVTAAVSGGDDDFATLYNISFSVITGGAGFTPSVPVFDPDDKDNNIIFLRLTHFTELSGTICERTVNCIGRLFRKMNRNWWKQADGEAQGTGSASGAVASFKIAAAVHISDENILSIKYSGGKIEGGQAPKPYVINSYNDEKVEFDGPEYERETPLAADAWGIVPQTVVVPAQECQNGENTLRIPQFSIEIGRGEDDREDVTIKTDIAAQLTFKFEWQIPGTPPIPVVFSGTIDTNIKTEIHGENLPELLAGEVTGIGDHLVTIDTIENWYDDGMCLSDPGDPNSTFPESMFNKAQDRDEDPAIRSFLYYEIGWQWVGHRALVEPNPLVLARCAVYNFQGMWIRKNAGVMAVFFWDTKTVTVPGHWDGLSYIAEHEETRSFINHYYHVCARFRHGSAAWSVVGLNYYTQRTFGTNVYARYSLFDDTGSPRIADTNNAPKRYLQYGETYDNMAPVSVRFFQLNPRTVASCWTTNAADANDDFNGANWDKITDRTVAAEATDTVRGHGAIVNIEMVYANDGVNPTTIIKAQVVEGGENYFTRPDIGNIIVFIYQRGSGYVYKVPFAARRGAGGGLTLDTPEGSQIATKVLSPEYEITPPNNGATAQLKPFNLGGYVTGSLDVSLFQPGAGFPNGGWDVAAMIERDDNGTPVSSRDWKVGDDVYYVLDDAKVKVGTIGAIIPAKSYQVIIDNPGKYKLDVQSLTAEFAVAGVQASISIVETAYYEDRILEKGEPFDSSIYKVTKDEVMGNITTYWKWTGLAWEEVVDVRAPSTDDGINRLQYVYNGAFTAFSGFGILPFILKIKGDDIELLSFAVSAEVATDLTAPEEFTYKQVNTVLDPVVPALFCRAGSDSPSVISFSNGRWWFASTPNQPDRIWVSKPVKKREDTLVNFSTYVNFVTIRPELTAFQAENTLNTASLKNPNEGVCGIAKDVLAHETRGKEVSFGIVRPNIVGTPYFKNGAEIVSAFGELVLSASSIPVPNEYYQEDLNELTRKYTLAMAIAGIRAGMPMAFGYIVFDCDGYEVRTFPATSPMIGMANALTLLGTASIAVPYTGWPTYAMLATSLASATASAVLSQNHPVAMAAIGGSCAAALAGAKALVATIMSGLVAMIKFKSTENKALDAPESAFTSALTALNRGSLTSKYDYLVNTYKLYEEKQPFVMRVWKPEEKQYSTVGCGFTFTMSSDEREDINFIIDNRSFFIGTTSSERIMPATINGESQSSQTASFLGSEKLQPAKSRDSTYFLQGGGQRLIRSFWQPNVPVPSTADVQKYNREILRNREVISLKASKSLPSQVWCVCKDGAVAVATDASGTGSPTWNRVSSYDRILDTAAVQTAGRPALRVVCIRDAAGVYMCGASEAQSEPDDTFLDNWEDYFSPQQRAEYTSEAVIYNRNTGEVYPLSSPPVPEPGLYIGYRFRTAMRTLPMASAQALRPTSVKRVRFRFMESGLPYIAGTPSGTTDRIVSDEDWHVLDGVADVPVPGNIEMDAAFEVFTEDPKPLSIVCMSIDEEVPQ